MPNSNAQLETAACSQNAGKLKPYCPNCDNFGSPVPDSETFVCEVCNHTFTPDPLTEALAELQRAIDKAKAAADSLPAFPHPAPKCCAQPDFRHLERGYTRQTFVNTEDEEGPIAQTDGWDDYSEEGDFQYIRCTACGKRWSTPATLEWQ